MSHTDTDTAAKWNVLCAIKQRENESRKNRRRHGVKKKLLVPHAVLIKEKTGGRRVGTMYSADCTVNVYATRAHWNWKAKQKRTQPFGSKALRKLINKLGYNDCWHCVAILRLLLFCNVSVWFVNTTEACSE